MRRDFFSMLSRKEEIAVPDLPMRDAGLPPIKEVLGLHLYGQLATLVPPISERDIQ
jgi:hypothetical protein